MTIMVDGLDLAPIKARAEAATSGPWTVTRISAPGYDAGGDGDFIAHAHDDVVALVAEVERLREALI